MREFEKWLEENLATCLKTNGHSPLNCHGITLATKMAWKAALGWALSKEETVHQWSAVDVEWIEEELED